MDNDFKSEWMPQPHHTLVFWFGKERRFADSVLHVSTEKAISGQFTNLFELDFSLHNDGMSPLRVLEMRTLRLKEEPIALASPCTPKTQIDIQHVKS
jgi:hypothetical protein